MGLDARTIDANVVLTDTMILFTLDPVSNTAGMISIPPVIFGSRSLAVTMPRSTPPIVLAKFINCPAVDQPWLLNMFENSFGVPVHYYAQIDFEAFIDFIDLIKGVRITPTESVQLNIINTKFSQWIEPGITVTLPGELALAYVRFRDEEGGDIARSQRQQQVILAIRDRILEFNMLPSLIQSAPQIYESLSRGIHTNLSLQQMIQLGIKVLNDVPRETLFMRQLAGNKSHQVLSMASRSCVPSQTRSVKSVIWSLGRKSL